MDIDPKYFPLIVGAIGVIGVALGTLLSEIRTWIENRRNSKKILKSALYHQFELFGEMLAFDREISGGFIKTLQGAILNLGAPKQTANEMFEELPPGLFKMLEAAKSDSFKEALEKHEATMIKLSEVDPLFALSWSYRSRSRFPDQMKIFFSEASSFSTEKNEVTDKFVEHIQEWFSEKSQKRLLNSLEKGIVEIAWRINLATWWKTRREVRKWRQNLVKDTDKEVQEYIMQIVEFAMKNQELIQRQMQSSFAKDTDEKI